MVQTILQKVGLSLVVLVGLLITATIVTQPTHALSGSQFQAGNIIDDAVFFNRSSMSVQDIQNFLNAKVPNCDTWGTQMHSSGRTRAQHGAANGSPAPYTCLKNYTQNTPSKPAENQLCNAYGGGTKSSAQIIYDVAQVCGINPQVLLVLLQKEQSLITDDWPWPIQYRSATGYGCPDTAPCDAEYYGFFNQVYNAARIYKKYARDANSYNYRAGRNNSILYNPNAACGSSNVYIQNQATAGLYVYTPYQPNQAALNNLYGSGDGCSAYGNRNFWRMFSDWFGSTSFFSLMRTEASPALYKISDSKKFNIPSREMQEEYGLGGKPVSIVSQSTLNGFTTPAGYSPSLQTQLIKTPDDGDKDGGSVYVVSRGKKYLIPSMEVFNSYNFGSWNITYLPIQFIEEISGISNMSYFLQAPDNTVYKVENGKKRIIFDLATLNNLNPSGNVIPVSNLFLSKIPTGNPILQNDALIVYPDKSVDLVVGGNYYRITSADTLQCWGFTSVNKIKEYRVASFANLVRGNNGTLRCNVSNGTEKYLLNGSNRIQIPSGVNIPTVTDNPQSVYNKLPSGGALKTAVKTRSSDKVWYIDGQEGKKRLIPSIHSYISLGINDSNMNILSDGAVNAIPEGSIKLGNGDLVKASNSPAVYLIDGQNKINVASSYAFDSYGLGWGKIQTVSASVINSFTTASSPLSSFYYANSNVHLADLGKTYRIDPSIYGHFSVNNTSIQQQYNYQPYIYSNTKNGGDLSRFIKSNKSDAVYYVENGQKRLIRSWATYLELSNNEQYKINTLSETAVNRLSNGSPI